MGAGDIDSYLGAGTDNMGRHTVVWEDRQMTATGLCGARRVSFRVLPVSAAIHLKVANWGENR